MEIRPDSVMARIFMERVLTMRMKVDSSWVVLMMGMMGALALPARASSDGEVCVTQHRSGDFAQCPYGMEYVHQDGADFCRKPGSIVKEVPLCRYGALPVAGPGHDRCPERMPASASK